MLTANEVADALLLIARRRGEPVENLKLQKLLYYAQAWHLALHDRPLFGEDLEAWITGPVVPSVYWRFKEYGIHDIDEDVTEPTLSNEEAELLEEIAETYLCFNKYELGTMACHETPWMNARSGTPEYLPSCAHLSHEDMRTYFRSRLSAQAA